MSENMITFFSFIGVAACILGIGALVRVVVYFVLKVSELEAAVENLKRFEREVRVDRLSELERDFQTRLREKA